MAVVVFLRGVNVGKHKRFLPAQVVKELAEFDAVNVGAAGTFVIRKPGAQSALRREISHCLDFDAEVAIVKGSDLLTFVDSEPFGNRPPAEDEQRFVTVLIKPVRKAPSLPCVVPQAGQWQVKVVTVTGQFVASVWKRGAARPIYPNAVVEKEIGPGTSRNWNTIRTICKILQP